MELPIPAFSIIAFILTFCVGYITLLFSYFQSGRILEWYSIDMFDKTIQTFLVGGIISVISLFTLNAPVAYLFEESVEAYNVWAVWFSRNLGVMVLFELTLVLFVSVLIQMHLLRQWDYRLEYVS